MTTSPASPRAARRAAEPRAEAEPAATVRVTYRKSAIGYAHDQKATVLALGLHRLHQTVEHPDTPALRGMVQKVRHLVSVDGVAADSPEVAARLAAGGPLGSPGPAAGARS
ncbi:MAG: 50S ribosomal protein L30 [Candidatus Dormibacteria bacterium]